MPLYYDIATKIHFPSHRHHSTNGTDQSDSRKELKPSFNDKLEDSKSATKNLLKNERGSKDEPRPHSNELSSNEAISDIMNDASVKHNNDKLSESISGQKRIAMSPPLSSSVVYPSSPERYTNDSKRTTQTVPSPVERHSFLYNRRGDHQDRHYKTTNNNREDGEIVESDDEKEDGEVSSFYSNM